MRDKKERLMDELRRCDFCSTSMAEHSNCYEDTAKDCGKRSKECSS